MRSFPQLKKNLKNDFTGMQPVKVALLGDSATQLLSLALRGAGYDDKLNLKIWEAGYNQVERQVFDPTSELYQFGPQVVIIFQSVQQLLYCYDGKALTERINLADERLALIDQLNSTMQLKGIRVIYYNYPELDDSVIGNHANKVPSAFLYQLRRLNFKLMEYAAGHGNFYIADLSLIQQQIGRNAFFQPSVYVNMGMVLSIDALPYVAARTTALIGALWGRQHKCLVFDLDNTIWGGVIGDDGPERIQLGNLGIGKVFSSLQSWIKKLQQRGIILAVCSKNNEAIVRQVFEQHPDMVLRSDDITVFRANWNNKADNIREIQQILNIGFDAMVFLDDNPFEREMVRNHVPGITVPELPEDPADYMEYLYSLNLFETVSVTESDGGRTRQYQEEDARRAEKLNYADEAAFLQKLDMKARVEDFTPFNIPRVAQLSQRSNQFNLRTIRYTEPDIERLANEQDTHCFALSLRDRFGDYGLIAVVIVKSEDAETLFIDTWLMSCRVLSRGMEQFTLNVISEQAHALGYHFLKGQYLATQKNELVKDHYQRLGFTPNDDYWLLNLSYFKPATTFISRDK